MVYIYMVYIYGIYIWYIYGIYIWYIYGIYIWYIYGIYIYVVYIWCIYIYGIYIWYIYMVYIYLVYIYGIYIWYIYGIYIWYIYGIYMVYIYGICIYIWNKNILRVCIYIHTHPVSPIVWPFQRGTTPLYWFMFTHPQNKKNLHHQSQWCNRRPSYAGIPMNPPSNWHRPCPEKRGVGRQFFPLKLAVRPGSNCELLGGSAQNNYETTKSSIPWCISSLLYPKNSSTLSFTGCTLVI